MAAGRRIESESEARRCIQAAKRRGQSAGEWARAHGIDGREDDVCIAGAGSGGRGTGGTSGAGGARASGGSSSGGTTGNGGASATGGVSSGGGASGGAGAGGASLDAGTGGLDGGGDPDASGAGGLDGGGDPDAASSGGGPASGDSGNPGMDPPGLPTVVGTCPILVEGSNPLYMSGTTATMVCIRCTDPVFLV